MQAAIRKDSKIRLKNIQGEWGRIINKFLQLRILQKYRDKKDFRREFLIRYLRCYQQKSATRAVNRCILTGRGRGVIRRFGISRTPLREFLRFGVMPGFRKAVW